MKLLNSIIFYLTLNVLLAIVMFVSGFDFVFPQEGSNQQFSYFVYGVLELITSVITVAEHFESKED